MIVTLGNQSLSTNIAIFNLMRHIAQSVECCMYHGWQVWCMADGHGVTSNHTSDMRSYHPELRIRNLQNCTPTRLWSNGPMRSILAWQCYQTMAGVLGDTGIMYDRYGTYHESQLPFQLHPRHDHYHPGFLPNLQNCTSTSWCSDPKGSYKCGYAIILWQ